MIQFITNKLVLYIERLIKYIRPILNNHNLDYSVKDGYSFYIYESKEIKGVIILKICRHVIDLNENHILLIAFIYFLTWYLDFDITVISLGKYVITYGQITSNPVEYLVDNRFCLLSYSIGRAYALHA